MDWLPPIDQHPAEDHDYPGRTGVALVCLLLVLSFFLSSCYKPAPCRNEISSSASSPNEQLRAVVFKRICPYEQTVTTNISILRAGEPLPEGNGNAFNYPENTPTRVAWIRDGRLAVYTYGDLSKATKVEKLGAVAIEYSVVMETDLIGPLQGH